MKLLHVVGARPQFIKLYPLLKKLNKTNIVSKVLHTGQHFDKNMYDIFFRDMGIPEPDYNLNVRSSMVSKMLEEISKVLVEGNFDSVLVYGDTNSTLAGALAGRQLGLKVIHYESGVRNLDPEMPEEINRVIIDRISDILLCVSDKCVETLENETCWYGSKIYKTGDLMYDSFLEFQKFDTWVPEDPVVEEKFVYVTVHRANNTDDEKRFTDIVESLCKINESIKVVFPIHPRTMKMMEKYSLTLNFEPLEPVGYIESLSMIRNSEFVITDSGGVVRESYWSNKPSILLVENPLWPELIELDACINCESTYDSIMESYSRIKDLNPKFNSEVYGDGNSAKIIREILNVR